MSDNYEYAEMLEIPVKTCTVSVKQTEEKPKRRRKKSENVKAKVVEKVNERVVAPEKQKASENAENSPQEEKAEQVEVKEEAAAAETEAQTEIKNAEESAAIEESKVEVEENKDEKAEIEKSEVHVEKKKWRFSLIGAETAIIVALAAVIIFTNIFMANSGINTLFKMISGSYVSSPKENNDAYNVFSAVVPADAASVTVDGGIMTVNQKGSIYTPCDGKVTSVKETNGKYSLEITHNKNFKTVINGMDYAYVAENDKVYSNVPVGYLQNEAVTVSFYSGENLITDYTIANGVIIWSV